MAPIVEFARHDIVFEVDSPRHTLEAVGASAADDWVLTAPVNLGAIGRELRGELVRRWYTPLLVSCTTSSVSVYQQPTRSPSPSSIFRVNRLEISLQTPPSSKVLTPEI